MCSNSVPKSLNQDTPVVGERQLSHLKERLIYCFKEPDRALTPRLRTLNASLIILLTELSGNVLELA